MLFHRPSIDLDDLVESMFVCYTANGSFVNEDELSLVP